MSDFKFKNLDMHFRHNVRREWPFWYVEMEIGFGGYANSLKRRLDGLHISKRRAERRAAALSNEITVAGLASGADSEVVS